MQKDEKYRLESSNAHRLLLTSILLATKLTDDDYFNNAHFAKVMLSCFAPVFSSLCSANVSDRLPELAHWVCVHFTLVFHYDHSSYRSEGVVACMHLWFALECSVSFIL